MIYYSMVAYILTKRILLATLALNINKWRNMNLQIEPALQYHLDLEWHHTCFAGKLPFWPGNYPIYFRGITHYEFG
jgi:hypothetical protein